MNNGSYNKFTSMPFIPYNIVTHLANDIGAENVWKLLKYNSPDAIQKPKLTYEEKMNLVWNNQDRQEEYGIFFTALVGNIEINNKTLIKIFQVNNSPYSKNIGVVSYAFDIIIGQKVALVNYNGIPCNRAELMEMELIKSLNGADVAGAGLIQFNNELSNWSGSNFNIGNNSTFTGLRLVMSLQVSNLDGNNQC